MTKARQIPGVVSVRVEGLDDRLFVKYDPARTDEAQVVAAVRDVIDNIEH